MGFILICHDTVIMVDHDATPDLLEKGLYGPPTSAVLQGPGHVTAHWDDEAFLKNRAPSVEGTLLLRGHEAIPPHGVVYGMVAISATDDAGGPAEVPDWVHDGLRDIAPFAKQIDDACRRRD